MRSAANAGLGRGGPGPPAPRAWSRRPAALPEPSLGPETAEARRVQDVRAAEAPEAEPGAATLCSEPSAAPPTEEKQVLPLTRGLPDPAPPHGSGSPDPDPVLSPVW